MQKEECIELVKSFIAEKLNLDYSRRSRESG